MSYEELAEVGASGFQGKHRAVSWRASARETSLRTKRTPQTFAPLNNLLKMAPNVRINGRR